MDPTIVIYAGFGLCGLGILLLVWCIRGAMQVKRLDNAEVPGRMRSLILLNFLAVFIGFMGLGVMALGFVL